LLNFIHLFVAERFDLIIVLLRSLCFIHFRLNSLKSLFNFKVRLPGYYIEDLIFFPFKVLNFLFILKVENLFFLIYHFNDGFLLQKYPAAI
jgi:hypothetical protein